ncbi:hypothetical protein MNBD_UNCLBAC01-816 [hydrothermal vent metagenome]|uniref:Glycosyl transferase family 1 domain-containing protein n=1 Tax=hydrothermal vent metagenome TaxID=652676 RepID=A0A3B1DQC3_9ZZZZ
MKIAFHSNQLCERGSEIALYDYAYFNEKLLNNNSVIISNKNNDLKALEKFQRQFQVFLYDDFGEVDSFLKREDVDVFYAIKMGKNDGIISSVCKTVIHCVFCADDPHGDVYACISPWVSRQQKKNLPTVPHMVHLLESEEDLRVQLNIPKEAIVFGRYGGYDTFDLTFAHKMISKIVHKRKDIFFLFMNTQPFYRSFFRKEHPQIIHLPSTIDVKKKAAFINTCDAMIHARERGETFGLAIGEFSIKNKPVLTWGESLETNHLEILKDRAMVYSKSKDLYEIINNFQTSQIKHQNWDAFSADYASDKVMKKFAEVFLQA